jgi:hypothetical protein
MNEGLTLKIDNSTKTDNTMLIIYRKEKKRKMDETTFQMYDRIGSTLFNDGVVNFGRILTLFVSTRRLCKKYPDYTQKL